MTTVLVISIVTVLALVLGARAFAFWFVRTGRLQKFMNSCDEETVEGGTKLAEKILSMQIGREVKFRRARKKHRKQVQQKALDEPAVKAAYEFLEVDE